MSQIDQEKLEETVVDKGVPAGELKLLALLMIMAIAFFYDSLNVEGIFQGNYNGSGTIAQMISLAMILFVGGRAISLMRSDYKEGTWQDVKKYIFNKDVVIVIVMILLYGGLVESLHFVPTSIIFLTVTMYLLERKKPIKKFFISCIFVGILYLIFSTVFQVVLP